MIPVYPYIGTKAKCTSVPEAFPPQRQCAQPGLEYLMSPRPIFDNPGACGSGKLRGRTALITGGDSGIGRAAAVAFAKEGADVAVSYLSEDTDAGETKAYIEKLGRRCLPIRVDLTCREAAEEVAGRTVRCFGRLDVLVNNQAVQYPRESILEISPEQLEKTFRTNVFAAFYLIQAALPYLERGASIINTASVTAYQGEPTLIDYSAAKGAVVSLTRSLALSLASRGIRVNAVAPGPVWTPLIPASFSAERVATFGTDTPAAPLGRAGQPFEIAPAYVFLASDAASYMTGQVLHPNGGNIING